MRRLKTCALAVVLLACAAGSARADGFVTPFYGYNFGGDTGTTCPTLLSLVSCENKHTNYGVSLGVMGKVFGFEEDLGFAKDFFGKTPNVDNSVFTAMTNLLLGVGTGPVQPYFLIGAGLIRTRTSLNPLQFNTEGNSLGYDVGGGINGYFSQHVGIRVDVRLLKTLQDVPFLGPINNVFEEQSLSFWRASLGLALKF